MKKEIDRISLGDEWEAGRRVCLVGVKETYRRKTGRRKEGKPHEPS